MKTIKIIIVLALISFLYWLLTTDDISGITELILSVVGGIAIIWILLLLFGDESNDND
jgi:hypothetical protein